MSRRDKKSRLVPGYESRTCERQAADPASGWRWREDVAKTFIEKCIAMRGGKG